MLDQSEMTFAHAKQDPEEYFDSPASLLALDTFSDVQKKQILLNWEDELNHRLETQAENMGDGKKSRSDQNNDEAMLQQVSGALIRLQQD